MKLSWVSELKCHRCPICSVFCTDELLYAIELRAVKIAQALGKFNRKIDEVDMDIIKKWHNENYIKSITIEGN